MKKNILLGIMSLALGLFAISCDEDDNYSIATGKLTQGVTTGSADVTANSAVFYGTVDGLQDQSTSAYEVGFYYGSESESLSSKVQGSLNDVTISASLDDLMDNQTIYYKAYVKLQSRIEYVGEVKSLVTTDAKISTSDVSSVGQFAVTFGGSISDYPSGTTCGVAIAASANEEAVRAGLMLTASELSSNFSIEFKGLLPSKTYYYAAYLNLGAGVIYGEVKSFTTEASQINVDDDFVDLGLSTKWCKYNLGASSETELGGYFAFGNMDGVSSSTDIADYTVAEDIYKTANDVVAATYGKATIPTADEYTELFSLCSHEWTEKDGVAGIEFTGPNGNKLFLPAAGSRRGSEVLDNGEIGYYLTGSINPSQSDFALSYSFGSSFTENGTSPRYLALSIRPVTVAKNIMFDKSLLFSEETTSEGVTSTTWFIDVKKILFNGPVFFYGTDDSWATVTNKEPLVGNVWVWEAEQYDWICPAADFGSMKLSSDGSVSIVYKDAEGMSTTAEGTYTVNEADKTISLSIDLLTPYNFSTTAGDGLTQVNSKTVDLKILSLDGKSMKIGVVRTSDPATLSINFVSDANYNGYEAQLTCYDHTHGDYADAWSSATVSILPGDLEGQHSVKFTTTNPREYGSVYILDIVDLAADYPNAFVRVDEIKADGVSIKYDANKFHYGNTEGAGKYRVEFANIWGKGANDGGNGISDNPFSAAGGEAINGPSELAFSSTFEVTFTIFKNAMGTYTPSLISINPSWGGKWSAADGAPNCNITIAYDETYKCVISGGDMVFTMDAAALGVDYSAGSIMTFIQIDNFPFLQPNMTLNSIKRDGIAMTGYDAAKVVNSVDGANYRYELWNMYGATSKDGCAFGTATADGVISELGFTSTLELSVTMNSLFPVPDWE